MPKEIEVKSVLNRKKARDPWFLDDYTFNPYSSCAFNCLYCYIRGSKYGHNLAESLSVKTNAVELLDRQLYNRAKKGQYGVIVLSSATDPYPGIEKTYLLTRDSLEVIRKHRFPVHMITKSDLVQRDFDLLAAIDKEAILPKDLSWLQHGTLLTFSFSALSDATGRIFEPGAPSPTDRLKALQAALDASFLSGVSFMPQLPYISDTGHLLEAAFSSFQEMGVHYVFPATITLFGQDKASSRILVLNAVRKHYPHLTEKYERLFSHSDELPARYQSAFRRKMEELSLQFNIPLSIQQAVKGIS